MNLKYIPPFIIRLQSIDARNGPKIQCENSEETEYSAMLKHYDIR